MSLDQGWDKVVTLESFIRKEQRMHPQSRGAFSDILRRIGVASKIVLSNVKRAGLLERHASFSRGAAKRNDQPRQFHMLANDIMKSALGWLPSVAGLASREENGVAHLPERDCSTARYIIFFAPLDGYSNIDTNGSVGTIFSIYRCLTGYDEASYDDFLQPGYKQAAAGYIMYGASTMFVFTTGQGVHGFTLDPEVGEYTLSHENILVPDKLKCISMNEIKSAAWDAPTKDFCKLILNGDGARYQKTSSRYIGSLTADFHRNLLYGGVYIYPSDVKTGQSKLRLMFECAPLAMIIEQAGGLASTGQKRILDITPDDLQQTVPLIIGNRQEVELYEKIVRDYDIKRGIRQPSAPPPSATPIQPALSK